MKIKAIFWLILLFSAVQNASAQTQTEISTNILTLRGRLTISHRDSVLIYYENNDGASMFQSRPIASDRFIISDSLRRPVSALIAFKDQGETLTDSAFDARAREHYIEPGRLYLAGDPSHPDSIRIVGSKSEDEFQVLSKRRAPVRKEIQPISDGLNKEKNPDLAAIISTQLVPYEDRLKAISYQFFVEHPDSYVTAHEMVTYVTLMGLDSAKHIYHDFPDDIKESPDGQRIEASLKKLEAVQSGSMAPEFTAKDIDGNAVSLAECRGSYVLLNFWASWNRPSRQNNVRLAGLFEKYNAKGFEIINIADNDATLDAWKKAVADDKMSAWANILSGAGTDNDLADKYSVYFMPTQILIDPSGKIIGRFGDSDNMHANALLDKTLLKIFGN